MVDRVVMGDWNQTGDYRIRGSKVGYNVLAALDPEQLAFDSGWKDGGIVYRTGVAVNPGDPVNQVTVAFGETLPSIPFVYSWRVLSSTETQQGAKATSDPTYITWQTIASATGVTFARDHDNSANTGYTVGFLVIRSLTDG